MVCETGRFDNFFLPGSLFLTLSLKASYPHALLHLAVHVLTVSVDPKYRKRG
jgi:hypothetical protein